MLQALTGQGGTPGGGADHEPAGHLIGCCPELIPGALEPEHGVEDVHRDHGFTVGGVGGARGGERSGSPGLVDPRVQDHTLGGFLVREHQFAVHGEVVLPVGVIDLRGREEGVHPKRPGLVRDDGYDAVPEVLLPHQVFEDPHERHGRGRQLFARTLLPRREGFVRGQGDRLLGVGAIREEPPQLLTALQQILDFGGVGSGVVVGGVVEIRVQLLITDRDP
ncbi:hypothetical protein PCS70012_02317 [Streptococcus pneumoniae PCS70012]|nr:hypothetical protein PCS70012_02317 [Streptococcus pneumoniae PCS70012]